MAWEMDDPPDTTQRFLRNVYDRDIRIISPTETEKCVGFQENWTCADDDDIDTQAGRNRAETQLVTLSQYLALHASCWRCVHAWNYQKPQQ